MNTSLTYSIISTLRLTRNGRKMYEQIHNTIPMSYTESAHQRTALVTNMATPTELDLSGVTSAPAVDEATVLFLQTDRDILVAVNDIARLWPVRANGALLLTSTISHLYVQNESTTNIATVELVAAG